MKTLISWTMRILVVATGSLAFGQAPMFAPTPTQFAPAPGLHPHQQAPPGYAQYTAAQAPFVAPHQRGLGPGVAHAQYAPVQSPQYAPVQPQYAPVQPQYFAQMPGPHGNVQAAGCATTGCSDGGCASGGCSDGGCAGGGCASGNCGGILGGLGLGLFGGDSCHGPFGSLSNLASCGYGGYASQKLGQENGPFGNGGCCKPRWFDFSADFLYWERETDGNLALSSQGILGPTVLGSSNLEDKEEAGFRVTGAYLIAPATAIEASYFGGFNWSSSYTATGAGNLFSVFSLFGSDPLNGFPDTGEGNVHSLATSSELDSGEINLRHRWVSANCLVHTSWMVGARYIRVSDDLVHNTQTANGGMNYQLQTDNDLVGAQIGTDMLFCVSPRFKFGAEAKAGVFGTHSKQRTDLTFIAGSLEEFDSESDVAFAGEIALRGIFRITPRLALRTGYELFYVSGIATGIENFNTASPFSGRDSFIDNSGEAFYHGGSVGFEWTW